MSRVDIGYLEHCESWEVESRLFPSKVGGKPAWLDIKNLPNLEDLQCSVCKNQLIFLCQIYAPYEEDSNNFHRSLFVFVCRNYSCSKRNVSENFKAFRNHLQRQNEFYSSEPPSDLPDPNFSPSKWVDLCRLCGCKAEKHCSKCKVVTYCTREHQVFDWKEGHKQACGQEESKVHFSGKLFPEWELVIEPEENIVKEIDENKELQEYERLQQEGKTGTMADISEDDLQAHASVEPDKSFAQFRKRIESNTDQVLRYERGGEPLWIAADPKPTEIPCCEYCGDTRQFEFQIMPQMLTMLKEEVLDFGVLVVYTCKSSCTAVEGYKREFIYRQDKTLAWWPWFTYKAWAAGSTTLAVCDYLGETLASILGITTPKYQFELEEYKRVEAERLQREKDAEGWSEPAPTTIPLEEITTNQPAPSPTKEN